MRAVLAILFTIVLLAACYVVSALISFDLTWILIWLTSLWVAVDSARLELNRYKVGLACRPAAIFCVCALLWALIFPWYLWTRQKIKSGRVVLKDDGNSGLEQRPVRRFFRKMSKVARVAVECVLILLVGFKIFFTLLFLEESQRGRRVWESYRQELEAKGENFDWDAMIPPPVRASDNFFTAPRMSEWFIRTSSTTNPTNDLSKRLDYSNSGPEVLIAEVIVNGPGTHVDSGKAVESLRFDDSKSSLRAQELIHNLVGPSAFGVRGSYILTVQPPTSNQMKPLHIFLEAEKKPLPKDLIAFLCKDTSGRGPLTIRPDGTNKISVLTSYCSAADYVRWSEQFGKEFDLIREALERPFARMDGDYHDPTKMPIPNYVTVRAVAQTLAQRAQCHLLLGQPEKALQDLTLVHDLCRVLEGAPTGKPMTLVAAMINVAVTGLYTDVIGDGFRLHAWKEPQIVMLQKQLAGIDLAPFLKESFHEEQVSIWRTMETMMSQFVTRRVPNATFREKITHFRPRNNMAWFFYLNTFNTVRIEQTIMNSIDCPRKIVSPQKAASFQREVDALGHIRHPLLAPDKLVATIAVPNFARAVQTFALVQTRSDEAQIVCALERYRVVHGKYPEALDELLPKFIEKLPHDIIGGQPMKYSLEANGQFTLYSVGWNEKDDGGQFSVDAYGAGDWIWN